MRVSRRDFLASSAAVLTAAGCAETDTPEESSDRPEPAKAPEPTQSAKPQNIVFIVMDTTRVDRCSAYGYERDTTPFMRELCAEATRYTNAYSTSCWTVPAHGSMLTGDFAIRHNATQENLSLAAQHKALPERLKQAGYATLGVMENAMLLKARGFGQGFDTYHEAFRLRKKLGLGNGEIALRLFSEAFTQRDKATPFFTFINLIAPHSPYTAPVEFRETFFDGPLPKGAGNRWRDFYAGRVKFSEHQLNELRQLYEAEIAHTDYIVRKIAELIQEDGTWDDTLFIVTADHGENIGDHGHMDHVFCLYDTVTRAPLVIRDPRQPGGRTDERPVQVHDLYPTVLRAAGVDIANDAVHGLDLSSDAIATDRPMFCEYYYPEQALRGFRRMQVDEATLKPYLRRIRSVVHGGMKYVWGSDGNHALYDLREDPGETRNVFNTDAHKDAAATLNAMLRQWTVASAKGAAKIEKPQMIDENLDEDAREALETLGYL